MVKDFRGNDVEVGDTIVYAAMHGRSSCLHVGIVDKITEKTPKNEYDYNTPGRLAKLPTWRRVKLSVTITKCMNDWLYSIQPTVYREGGMVPNPQKTSKTTLLEGRWMLLTEGENDE